MSSLRNNFTRRPHRERAQPASRSKWGLLEKHKDYSLRAADHNLKKRKLKALSQKARERNEDEFYFGMVNERTEKGVKVAERNGKDGQKSGRLGEETVKLMKTQDEGYLRTVLGGVKRARERVEREVMLGKVGVGVGSVGGHGNERKVFGEDGLEVVPELDVDVEVDGEADDFDDFMSEDEKDEQQDANDTKDLTPEQMKAKRRKQHTFEVKKRQLERLKQREEQLTIALRGVEEQKARMNGTTGGVNKNGITFKQRQRKR
ncbi:hypothetical protein BAUCODRAFT_379449 [Baudoinia panamericana UAMH 10762]|uniref:U3 small nucleolar RNA-associated protein 11 n=1 Tax=Baudoinia panamericana (strain UAMH 10762) TaxID=717646 RepID=M2N424_BAUPA|nr:uncharacterized protein BAUCODRAFT_379449 [Baudoinia panamericana UAMH 10762]EMC98738.1 hypothetical protein BAUCODRAFT_379449 [Baudoinia panamericana UAMH 10762]